MAPWAWWLAAPALVTLLAAVLTWWAGRPPRPITSRASIRDHRAFLETLDDQARPAPDPARTG